MSNDYIYNYIIFLTPNTFACNTTTASLELFSYNGIITGVDNVTMHHMRTEPYGVSFSIKKPCFTSSLLSTVYIPHC